MNRQTLSKIILVDLDGPLADLEAEFLRCWKKKFPGEFFVPFENRKNFFLRDDYPENLKAKTETILKADGFFADLPAVAGGLQEISAMREAGFSVIICTSDIFANKTGLRDKREWVIRNIGEDFAKTMIFTRDKTVIRGNYLIDDKPVIKGALEPVWEHVIFDQPFNRETSHKKRMKSDWSNWQEIIKV